MLDADAGAEQLHAAAGAGGLDLRGLELGGVAELLGHGGREREHGRRADDVDAMSAAAFSTTRPLLLKPRNALLQ
jgi:hypothetical protein